MEKAFVLTINILSEKYYDETI